MSRLAVSDFTNFRNNEDFEQIFPRFSSKKRPQIIASLIATIGTFCTGTVLAWSSAANPQLKISKDIGELTDSNLSWIASLAVVGALTSGFAAGFSIDRIGRKLTLILLVVPFVLGWFLVAFSTSLGMMFAGRFITGFCAGAYTLVVPVYISEITEDKLRGTMSGCMVVNLVLGILFSYVLGALVSWKWLSLVCGILPLFFALPMLFMPDSPRYLLSSGKAEKAGNGLKWLRGATFTHDIEPELKEMISSIEESSDSTASFKELLTARTIKPIGICLLLMVFQQLGGINAVIFFTVDIFKTSGSDIDPNLASIIVGLVQVISVIISTLLVERAGRKILMFISETGMAISLAALGIFFYLKHQNNDEPPENLGWLPLVSMIMYIITYNLGCASLPWTLMGELCPSHVKGPASALVTTTNWCLAFIVTYTFADLRSAIGDHFVFWIFGCVSAVGALFSALVLPETRNLSLDEIQRLF